MRMKQLRHEMERSRTLLEMMKKREKMKRHKVEAMIELFDTQCIYIRELEQMEGPPPPKKRKIKQQTPSHISSHPIIVKLPKPKKLKEPPSDVYEFDKEDSISERDLISSSEYSPSDDSPPGSPKNHINGELFPSLQPKSDQLIQNGVIPKGLGSFRGRVRVGRGGRVICDRIPLNRINNGIVPWWESDQESNERLNSLADLNREGFHPLTCGRTDAEKLLKKLLTQEKQRKE